MQTANRNEQGAEQGLHVQGAPLARLAQCPRLQLPEGLASPSQELLSSMPTLVTKYLVLELRYKVQGLDNLKLSCWSSPPAPELDRKSYGMAPLSPSSQRPVHPLTESFHPVSLGPQPSDLILATILPLLNHCSPLSQRPMGFWSPILFPEAQGHLGGRLMGS